MNRVVIKYEHQKDFYDGILELTIRGLTFELDFNCLEIYLTRGY